MIENYPKPTPQMAIEARRAAQEAAEQHSVSIERICVVGSPDGIVDVIVLDDPLDDPEDQDDPQDELEDEEEE